MPSQHVIKLPHDHIIGVEGFDDSDSFMPPTVGMEIYDSVTEKNFATVWLPLVQAEALASALLASVAKATGRTFVGVSVQADLECVTAKDAAEYAHGLLGTVPSLFYNVYGKDGSVRTVYL